MVLAGIGSKQSWLESDDEVEDRETEAEGLSRVGWRKKTMERWTQSPEEPAGFVGQLGDR